MGDLFGVSVGSLRCAFNVAFSEVEKGDLPLPVLLDKYDKMLFCISTFLEMEKAGTLKITPSPVEFFELLTEQRDNVILDIAAEKVQLLIEELTALSYKSTDPSLIKEHFLDPVTTCFDKFKTATTVVTDIPLTG